MLDTRKSVGGPGLDEPGVAVYKTGRYCTILHLRTEYLSRFEQDGMDDVKPRHSHLSTPRRNGALNFISILTTAHTDGSAAKASRTRRAADKCSVHHKYTYPDQVPRPSTKYRTHQRRQPMYPRHKAGQHRQLIGRRAISPTPPPADAQARAWPALIDD
jgi:hypothetical protein